MTKLAELKPGMADYHVSGFVKSRGELKPYKTDTKAKWFDFKLSDDEHAIRVVCFKDVSEKYDKIIQSGKYYSIKDGTIQETHFRGNTSIEIILTKNSVVERLLEKDINFQVLKFPLFDSIIDIISSTKTKVNIIGFVKYVSDDEQVIVDGKTVIKKPCVIFDEHAQITITLWNRPEELTKDDLVAIEDGIVKEYHGGKSINVSGSSNITVNPECNEAERLRKWKSVQKNDDTSHKLDISYCSQPEGNNSKFSNKELLLSAVEELRQVEEKQQELEIKRVRLTQEIDKYNAL